jgi:hypothetical protein
VAETQTPLDSVKILLGQGLWAWATSKLPPKLPTPP